MHKRLVWSKGWYGAKVGMERRLVWSKGWYGAKVVREQMKVAKVSIERRSLRTI